MILLRSTESCGGKMTEVTAKPTVSALGVDTGALTWQRSGDTPGCLEIAFVGASGLNRAAGESGAAGESAAAGDGGAEWVLMRVADDPEGRVLVYDRNEWECFLDGVRGGEFDDAADD
jgi:Domain of unknown function (DUF397)